MDFITLLGLLVLSGLAVFQLLLSFGAPLGDFAWGGQRTVLSRKLRAASIVSIILYGVFAVFLTSKAGMLEIITQQPMLSVCMWICTGYFTLGIFLNAISRSKKERIVMTPIAAILALIFLLITMR